MIDERFSKAAFDAAGWGSEDSRSLCGQLDAEIQRELMEIIKPVMYKIVGKLNAMGHALNDVSDEFGEIHFREPLESTARGRGFKTIVAADLVVTVGYPQSQRTPDA